jgi:hypothetical protein
LEDHLMGDVDAPTAAALSRRRLFELGATSVGLAALLAACGNDEDPAPGRVGNAPEETDLSTAEVNDLVYLRTLTSLEYSILAVYEALSEIDGLDEDVTALLARFRDDHSSAADTLAELTSAAGGEPYECPNSWLMRRTLQPVLDHIIGVSADGTEIPPSDDPTRDALATADALETIAAATAQQYVERLADPATRADVITVGTAASRRAATAALHANPPPEGYVSPALTDGEEVATDEQGFMPEFAIPSRFGQLTPVTLQVGAADDAGQRFTINIETPAENAYVYEGQTCPA